MKAITKGDETTVDFTPLLKHGKWGLLAFVVIAIVYIVSTNGMKLQFQLGPSSISSPAVAER